MFWLFIETSTECGAVIFFQDQQVVFENHLPVGLSNAKYLATTIQNGLDILGKQVKDLDLIGCGVGPGSYTGMRVGAMIAKTLSYAHQVPLVGISTLSCFLPDEEGPFAAAIDARIGGVYMLTGIKTGDHVEYSSEPFLCTIENLESYLKTIDAIVSPSVEPLRSRVCGLCPDEGERIQWSGGRVLPSCVSKQVFKEFHAGRVSIDGSLELQYLR